MNGKDRFTQFEAEQIRVLLRLKTAASSTKQKSIRAKLRTVGFFISDYSDVATPADFDRLVRVGVIKIEDECNAVDGFDNVVPSDVDGVTEAPTQQMTSKRDEHYVIDLCDMLLGQKALRQHKFSFLRGDPNIKGISVCLPVDAYYPSLGLVIEYHERQHTESVSFFDKRETVSGVDRAEQRRMYDERRRKVLPMRGIELVELSFNDFSHRPNKRLHRYEPNDIAILRHKLSRWISKGDGR